tara:strand:- start:285 stop:803 length:519 start_codon:yes stop_codon:yes gene_type:complete
MARRKSRKASKPRRRNSKAINVLNVAQTYLQTGIITRAAFRTNPIEFLTGQQTSIVSGMKFQQSTQTWVNYSNAVTGYNPIANGSAITLPELFGRDGPNNVVPFGGSTGIAGETAWDAIKENVSLNGGWITPVVQTAVLNVGFTVGKRLMRKQLGLTRKALKMANLDGMVKV